MGRLLVVTMSLALPCCLGEVEAGAKKINCSYEDCPSGMECTGVVSWNAPCEGPGRVDLETGDILEIQPHAPENDSLAFHCGPTNVRRVFYCVAGGETVCDGVACGPGDFFCGDPGTGLVCIPSAELEWSGDCDTQGCDNGRTCTTMVAAGSIDVACVEPGVFAN